MRIPTYRWNRHRKQGEPAASCTPAEVRCDCNTLGLGHVLGACNFIGPNVYHVNAKSLKTRKLIEMEAEMCSAITIIDTSKVECHCQ